MSTPVLSATSAPATRLVALADQRIYGVFSVTDVSALDIVLELARPEPSCGVIELKGPQKIGSLLEIGPNREDYMNQHGLRAWPAGYSLSWIRSSIQIMLRTISLGKTSIRPHCGSPVFAKVLLDDLVVGKRDPLPIHFAITPFVDELTDGLLVGVPICDKRFHDWHIG